MQREFFVTYHYSVSRVCAAAVSDYQVSFFSESVDDFSLSLLNALLDKLEMAFTERIRRLEDLAKKMPGLPPDPSKGDRLVSSVAQQVELRERMEDVKACFEGVRDFDGDPRKRDAFLQQLAADTAFNAKDYISTIKSLNSNIG